jgi:hypothetical protein
MQSAMTSSDSIAFSIRSTAGSHSPTGKCEGRQQSKETPPPLGSTTPPHSVLISKHHSSANIRIVSASRASLQWLRFRSLSSCCSKCKGAGRRLLLNVDSFETGASFPTTLDLRDPKNIYPGSTNQVIMEFNTQPLINEVASMSKVVASPLRTHRWIPTMRPS